MRQSRGRRQGRRLDRARAPSSDLWRVDEVAALTKDVVLVRFACTRDSVTPGTVWVTREATYFAPSLVGKVSSFFSFSSKKEEKLIRMARMLIYQRRLGWRRPCRSSRTLSV